jgi:hypothetical protein
VYVLLRGGEIVAQGPPAAIFRDPGLLRRSNIEPPVLAELFQRLEDLGVSLGRPVTVEDAAAALARWASAPGAAPAAASATEAGALPGRAPGGP